MKTRILFAAAVLLVLPTAACCQVVSPIDRLAYSCHVPLGPCDLLPPAYPPINIGALDVKLHESGKNWILEMTEGPELVMYLGRARVERFTVAAALRRTSKVVVNWYPPGEKMPVHHSDETKTLLTEYSYPEGGKVDIFDAYTPPKPGLYFVQLSLQDKETGIILAHAQEEFYVIPKE